MYLNFKRIAEVDARMIINLLNDIAEDPDKRYTVSQRDWANTVSFSFRDGDISIDNAKQALVDIMNKRRPSLLDQFNNEPLSLESIREGM